MDQEWLSTYPKKMPSAYIEDEAWVQCWLRLTMRLQAEVGIPFDNGEPGTWCDELKVDDIVRSPEGLLVQEAMSDAELSFDFQDEYALLLEELDHQSPSFAHRLAFNELMDARWDGLKAHVTGAIARTKFMRPIGL